MKIGVASALLEKSADELRSDLQIELSVEELNDEQVKFVFESYGKGQFSKGKDQGKDWGHKNAMSEAEKLLGEKIGAKGLFKDLLEKVNKPDETKSDIYKEKYNQLSIDFENFKSGIEKDKKNRFIEQNVFSKLVNYEGTDSIKKLVAKEFIEKNIFEVDGDLINPIDSDGKHLKKDGKFVEFDDLIESHFSSYLTKSSTRKNAPNPDAKKDDDTSSKIPDMKSAMQALFAAKTSEEKEIIQKRIIELEKK